jgi:hypothetical protein
MGEVALIRDTPSHYSPVLIAPFVNLGRRRDGAEIFFWTADGGAPDEKAAELMAAKAFTLSEWQRKRLLVRERL